MCIIAGPVDDVSKTKIFVLPSHDKQRQMTFYSNAVASPMNNLMILPVPYPSSVILHSIEYKNLFQDLAHSVSGSRGFSVATRNAYAGGDTLDIIDHGSYLVSIVQSIYDLQRLDPMFRVTQDLIDILANEYSEVFGYICCVLKPGLHSYEPLCYSHNMLENEDMFVPTLHIHGDIVRSSMGDWDHLIYSANTHPLANKGFKSREYNSVDWRYFPETFRGYPSTPIRCMKIEGLQENRDIVLHAY